MDLDNTPMRNYETDERYDAPDEYSAAPDDYIYLPGYSRRPMQCDDVYQPPTELRCHRDILGQEDM